MARRSLTTGLAFVFLVIFAVRPSCASDEAAKLIALANRQFRNLTEADIRLLQAVADGKPAVFSDPYLGDSNSRSTRSAVVSNQIQADRITWLCTDTGASQLVTHRGVWIIGARIEGLLDLSLVKIPHPLLLVKCEIPEGIILAKAEIRELYLPGTSTGAVDAVGLVVERDVVLNSGFVARGEVVLQGAKIGGDLNCSEGQFLNPDGRALNAEEMKVDGDVFLRYGFESHGEVSLRGAKIGGDLQCGGGRFINTGPDAIYGDGLQVGGNVFMRYGFEAQGRVSLIGAHIGGNLDCDDALFTNPDWDALAAARLHVAGEATLSGEFIAKGTVNFRAAHIGGDLNCAGASFSGREGAALEAAGLNVGGDMSCSDDFSAKGKVNLGGAHVGGAFIWTAVKQPQHITLDLRSARMERLWDEAASWPPAGNLFLHGLVYDEIYGQSPNDAASRIKWLRRQPQDRFRPQPYEHLAGVLRKIGRETDAEEILIAKEEDRTSSLRPTEQYFHKALGISIGYGYRPWRAFWVGLVFVLLGSIVFTAGGSSGLMTATKEAEFISDNGQAGEDTWRMSDDYPRFNPIVYSLDMFVPLLDLHQANYWLPSAKRGRCLFRLPGIQLTTGGALRFYLGLHIYSGWTLTTLLAVGLSGLVQS